VTIFCIWLGLRVRQAQRRHEAVNAILAAGGTVWFDYQWSVDEGWPIPNGQPRAPAWLRSLFGDDFFRYPAFVGLGEDVTDQFIAQYADVLSDVHSLGIKSENVTDKSLALMAKMSQLQFLGLDCPNVTPAGLRQLAPLRRLKGLYSYKDSEDQKYHMQLYTRGNFDCPGNPLVMLPEILDAQFAAPVRWDLLEGEQLPDKLLTETISNAPLQAVIEKTMKDCHLDYVVRVQNHAIVIASAAAARAHWPGYTTLRDMFPNVGRLEADW